MPASFSMSALTAVNATMPQSVWNGMSMDLSAHEQRWLMERASGFVPVITPPALVDHALLPLPGASPSTPYTLMRASTHATTATRFGGAGGRSGPEKEAA